MSETKAPRRPPRRVTVELPDDDGRDWKGEREKQKDDTISSEDLAMREAVRGLAQGERYVHLYRTTHKGGHPSFLAHLIPEEFDEGNVQERFGGGRYFARWKMEDGTWKRYPFIIEGKPKKNEEDDEADAEAEYENPEVLAATDKPSFSEILMLMSQAEERGFRRMQVIVEMLKPVAPPSSSTDQALNFVEKLIPVMQNSLSGDGQPWYVTLLTQFKEPITKLADAAHAAMTTRPAVTPGPGPVQAEIAPKPQPKPEPTEESMIKSMIVSYLPMLLNAAQKDGDTGIYIDLILEQTPKYAYAPLHAWLSTAGCLDELIAFAPEVNRFRGWLENLRRLLIGVLSEEIDVVRSVQPHEDTVLTTGPAIAGATTS